MAGEWAKVTLDQIKSQTPNAIAMGPFGSRIKTDNFVPSGVPVIRGGNLNAPRLLDDGFVFLTEEKADELRTSNARPGDIVITHRGTIGQVGIIPYDAYYPRYVVSQSQMKLTVDTEKADPFFIYYFLRSKIGQHQLLANTSQVGVPAIAQPTSSLKTIEVLLPPTVDEQRAIVHILRTLDDKIELNRRMNETLEAIARAMFKSWFVDFDPVRAKMNGEPPDSICQRLGLTPDLLALFPDRFVDSELGEIPEGWRISKLTIEAERHGGFIQTGPFGSQLHAADYVAEGVPVVMPQDLVNRRVSLVRIVRVTHEMTKRLSRHMLKPGDVVYSRRGDVERHALISERESDWLCGTGCLLVRLGDTWPSQAYLSEVLDLPVTRAWLVRHAVGATMPNLNTSILGAMPLLLAPESLLLAFEKIAGPLRKQQIAVNMESDSLALVRDALSPKLLSGELRMPVSEIAIEAMA